MTEMRHQNLPVHSQRVFLIDVTAVNRIEGTNSTKKVTQNHDIIRKMCKRTYDQCEVSAILTKPGYFVSRS